MNDQGYMDLPLLVLIISKRYSQTCLKGQKKWFCKTSDLLTQVNYSEKYTFRGLKGWSLNTGGFKDRFECIW